MPDNIKIAEKYYRKAAAPYHRISRNDATFLHISFTNGIPDDAIVDRANRETFLNLLERTRPDGYVPGSACAVKSLLEKQEYARWNWRVVDGFAICDQNGKWSKYLPLL